MNYTDILNFWFKELTPAQHFVKDTSVDELIKSRFSNIHRSASQAELSHWRDTIHGRLAEIIILDQFSRNIYRDHPNSFATDTMALVLAQEAISLKLDQSLTPQEKSFLYMPYMHSESLKIHEQALELYKQQGLEQNYDFEVKHKVIIEKFGRYPHRNVILGRESTPEEIDFLNTPGSSF